MVCQASEDQGELSSLIFTAAQLAPVFIRHTTRQTEANTKHQVQQGPGLMEAHRTTADPDMSTGMLSEMHKPSL